MPRQRLRRARPLAVLTFGITCAALIGCRSAPPGRGQRQIEVAVGVATSTSEPRTFMAAAEPRGQFEEPQRPTPAPTATPTSLPTLAPTPTPEPMLFETGIA